MNGNKIFEMVPNLMVQRDFSIVAYENVPNALGDPNYNFSDDEPAMILSKLGNMYSLNIIGACIFDLLDGKRDVNNVIDRIGNYFTLDGSAQQDIIEFLQNAFENGLIQEATE